ncbi:LCP family protein [Candidatus Woesearchaeota archaeon]|nr:LCP family protein [Candidatus Woesearchaeota archaeon]
MMKLVGQERYFLDRWFIPTLTEISQNENPHKAWQEHLSHFNNLVELLEVDLRYADILIKELKVRGYLEFLVKPSEEEIRKNRTIIVNNFVKLIEAKNYTKARYWISYGRWREMFNDEEARLLNYLVVSVEYKNSNRLEQLIKNDTFKRIFNKDEIDFFTGILNDIKKQIKPISPEQADKQHISRRQFLKVAGVTAATIAATGSIPLPRVEKREVNPLIKPLTLKIVKPLAGSSHIIGKPISYLEAEAEGVQSALINRGMLMKFIWKIRQYEAWATIHEGKTGKSQLPIPGNFALGSAKLGVFLYYNAELKAQSIIDIGIPDISFEPVVIPEVNKVIYTEGSYRNAKYIVVIPHTTELNALLAARQEAKGPITYVAETNGNNGRNLKITINKKTYQIDTNSAFCQQGIVSGLKELNNVSFDKLSDTEKQQLLSAIRRFEDEINRRVFHGRMVFALHQITNKSFSIESYQKDSKFKRHAADLNITPNASKWNFAYVNTRGWFEVLKAKGWNVILQGNQHENDDGSLSYAVTWRNLPYVNIEVEVGNAKKQAEMIKVVNELIEEYPELATDINFVPQIVELPRVFNILLIGSDKYKGVETKQPGERADALVLINTDTVQKVINVLTIPRDTYVLIPMDEYNIIGEKRTKINNGLIYGGNNGWKLQKKILEQFLGVDVHKVFYLGWDNLRAIFSFVSKDVGRTNFLIDIAKKLGIRNAKIVWDEIDSWTRSRDHPDFAVGRAKNHAKILAALIQTLREYYNDPNKRIIFDRSNIAKLMGYATYTNLSPEEVREIFKEWAGKEYYVSAYCVPGRGEERQDTYYYVGKGYIQGKVSYWIPANIPGTRSYFDRVINYPNSRI